MNSGRKFSCDVSLHIITSLKLSGDVCSQVLCDLPVTLYDPRFRRSPREQLSQAKKLGLTLRNDCFDWNSRCSGLIVLSRKDDWRLFAKICNKYFSIEPVSIGLNGGGFCHQRYVSFFRWRANRVRRVLYGSYIFRDKSGKVQIMDNWLSNCLFEPGLWVPEKVRSEVLRYFGATSLCSSYFDVRRNIPLPFFYYENRFKPLAEEWLELMTWYKTVACVLDPLTKKLSNPEIPREEAMEYALKLRDFLLECEIQKEKLFKTDTSNIFARASQEMDQVLTKVFGDFQTIDVADLQTIRIKPKTESFITQLFTVTINVVRHTMKYISELHYITPSDLLHSDLRSNIGGVIHEFHAFVRKLFSKRFHLFLKLNEDELLQLTLNRVGNILKAYLNDNFLQISNNHSVDELRQYQALVEKMHNLLRDLIIEVSYTFIDSFNVFYKLKMVKGCLEQLIYFITFITTYSATIYFWEGSKYGNVHLITIEMDNKKNQLKDLRLCIPSLSEYILSVQEQVDKLMIKCVDLISERETKLSLWTMSISTLDKDFSSFQRYLAHFFGVCPHPLLSPEEALEGRLFKFMFRTLRVFDHYRKAFDDALQLAQQNFLAE